jgi:multidrug resistance efflux pump
MTAGILILVVFFTIFWLVFFKFKLLRLSPAWGFFSAIFVIHLLLIFVIGLRFVTPNSTNATIVQRTIQLIPRLPEPTLVTAVLVEDNVPVKKDQPIFQFDRRPYEYKVEQIQAQLAEAKQNVKVLKTEVDVATQKTIRAKAELGFTKVQKAMFDKLAQEHAVKQDDIELWMTRISTAEATSDEALAELERANLKYKSEIDGVNTTVANLEAQLRQTLYYLDNNDAEGSRGRPHH